MNRACLLAPAGLVTLAAPATAHAHLVTSGLGPWYDGALHLLLSPGGVLGVVAAALLAGLRGARASRLLVIVLTLSWLIGGLLGTGLPVTAEPVWFSAIPFLIFGALVAADARVPPLGIAALGGMFGLLHGLLDGAALAAIGAGARALLGTVTTVLLLTLLTTAAVVPLRVLWARVAVRVVGSWVGAVGMLMLGWLAQGAG